MEKKRPQKRPQTKEEEEVWEGEEIQMLIQEYKDHFGTWKATAEHLGVSPAYLSAAGRGKAGTGPKICKGLEVERKWKYTKKH